MRYFNIKNYENLPIDEKTGLYKLGNGNMVQIIKKTDNHGFVERIQIKNTAYLTYNEYHFNNSIKKNGNIFYTSSFGIWKEYDEQGKLIKETNWDKPYKISIDDVVAKIKEKYNINLENREEKGSLNRYLSSQLNNQPIYVAHLAIKDEPYKMKYVLIDGTTGDILYETEFYKKGGGKNPFSEYLKSLKK
ncbi:hypothetical protein [Empedobacter tilapiae]